MHYAHWLPRGDKGWIDRLAATRERAVPEPGALNADSWHHHGTKGVFVRESAPEVSEIRGEPSGDRTQDPLIKSRGATFYLFDI